MFDRLITVIGKDKFDFLRKCRILIIGVGGVGGYALEALVRSGVENISIADYDIIELSNINRQIISLKANVGCLKVEEAKKRANSICPNCNVEVLPKRLSEEDLFLLNSYDYILDACDDVSFKVLLIKYCYQNNIKLISCMGTGNRLHPEKLQITLLKKTENDPLAKKIRTILRKEDPKLLNVSVVWSSECPVSSRLIGTMCSVPMSAGSLMASFVVQDVLKK